MTRLTLHRTTKPAAPGCSPASTTPTMVSGLGLAWLTPILKAAAGDNPRAQVGEIWRLLGVPLLAIAVFLLLWARLAPKVQTSLGAIPGPAHVWEEASTCTRTPCARRERGRFTNARTRATQS